MIFLQVHVGEYANLVPDNQYYEHIEFSGDSLEFGIGQIVYPP